MCIILHGEAKMAAGFLSGSLDDIFAAADEFDYRKREIWKMHGVGGPAFGKEPRKLLCVGFSWQRHSIFRSDLANSLPTLRSFNHTTDRRETMQVQKLGHLDICRDHEILDDPPRRIRPNCFDRSYFAVDDHRRRLNRFEFKRALLDPEFVKPLSGLFLK